MRAVTRPAAVTNYASTAEPSPTQTFFGASLDAATAAMAHEIGQPLAAISLRAATALMLLERTSPDVEKARDSISVIIAQGHRMEATIRGIRALFKQDTGNPTPVYIDEIARQVLDVMQPELQDRSVKVDTKFAENLPPVRADPVLLQQVILNLVANAIEAMAFIRSNARHLVLTTKVHGDSDVSLSIRDSGVGVTAENRGRIFEPFFTTKPAGMGLGLSICQAILENEGGKLRLAKTDSDGTVFEMSLPLRN